jgi:hypothetical protein
LDFFNSLPENQGWTLLQFNFTVGVRGSISNVDRTEPLSFLSTLKALGHHLEGYLTQLYRVLIIDMVSYQLSRSRCNFQSPNTFGPVPRRKVSRTCCTIVANTLEGLNAKNAMCLQGAAHWVAFREKIVELLQEPAVGRRHIGSAEELLDPVSTHDIRFPLAMVAHAARGGQAKCLQSAITYHLRVRRDVSARAMPFPGAPLSAVHVPGRPNVFPFAVERRIGELCFVARAVSPRHATRSLQLHAVDRTRHTKPCVLVHATCAGVQLALW